MDQWPQGVGEIPARPAESYDPRVQTASVQPHYPFQAQPGADIQSVHIGARTNGASSAPVLLPGEVRKSREEVMALRRQEREVGKPFRLKNSGMDARVRDLPFTDRILIDGIPGDMRTTIDKMVGVVANMTSNQQVASFLKLIGDLADLNDAYCISGFIWPKLVRTEEERQSALRTGNYADGDVWLVSDLDSEEKGAYRDWISRDRNGEKEDMARLASFPDAGLAEAANRHDRTSGQSVAVRGPEDGGVGLRA